MDSKRTRILFFSILLVFVIISCNLPMGSPEEPPGEVVATAVEETLTVIEKDVESPTSTSAPPEPTATEVPQQLKLVYTDASRDLWKWTEGESSTKLVDTGDVIDANISDDGSMVALVRSVDYKAFSLWTINLDGSGLRELVNAQDFKGMANDADAVGAEPFVYDWLPGQNKIVFVTAPVFDGIGLFVNDDLWTVDVSSGERKQVLPPGQGGIFYLSPDGSQMALVTPSSIVLVNSDGSNRREIFAYDPVLTYSEYRYYAVPKWASDGNNLLVAIPPVDPLADPVQPSGIWQLAVDGSDAVRLGEVETAFLSPVEFSPDRSKIAYLKEVGQPADNQRELYLANTDGTGSLLYHTAQYMDFKGWAPDSWRFVFSMGSDGNAQIGEAGAGFVPLTNIGGERGINWVDKDRFIFLSKEPAGWKIYLGKPGGLGELIAELPDASDAFFPTYSFQY